MTGKAVIGLAWGDESKGLWVSRYAENDTTVVRFNGGAQAAHNVHDDVHDAGNIHHTFSQFGSGTISGAATHLSRFFVLNPTSLWREWLALNEKLVTVFPTIDGRAKVVTEYHRAANKAREDARSSVHGSCGQGIGEVMADSLGEHKAYLIRAYMINQTRSLAHSLYKYWREVKAQEISDLGQPVPDFFCDDELLDEYVDDLCLLPKYGVTSDEMVLSRHSSRNGGLVYEGAQGVLLDEDVGFHPHTTWSRTKNTNIDLLTESRPANIGCIRTYMTRHGAGPFPTEDPTLDHPEPHNGTGEYQGAFRQGHFDLVALRYSTTVSDIHFLNLSHFDRLGDGTHKICTAYEVDGEIWDNIPVLSPDDFEARSALTQKLFRAKPIYGEEWGRPEFVPRLEEALDIPCTRVGYGPHTASYTSGANVMKRVGRISDTLHSRSANVPEHAS